MSRVEIRTSVFSNQAILNKSLVFLYPKKGREGLRLIDLQQFLDLSEKYNMIPVFEEIIVDTETPISLYKRLALDTDYSYLLESVKEGRYSFIGLSPERIIKAYQNGLIIEEKGQEKLYKDRDLVKYLKEYLSVFQVQENDNLPPFSGGFVGYFSYEIIDQWEELYHDQPEKKIKYSKTPLSILVLSRIVIAYDHRCNTVKIINNIKLDKDLSITQKKRLYQEGKKEIEDIIKRIKNNKGIYRKEKNESKTGVGELTSNTGKQEFSAMVKRAREHIKAGDVFQLVLSQIFSIENKTSPFQIFRALRSINPSPYLFYLNFPEVKLIGSSPEVLVKVEGKRVITRPLAGTRPRGKSRQDDIRLKNELMTDEKECAEHIMLVDLGRNDLGRICQTGSVEVTELMGVEYYSQVMHLVSQVEGDLKEGLDSLDVLRSVFPAGTVSGAPKIKAMELINELEKEPRGPYAGAVGYLSFNGNLDTCITIRTYIIQDEKLSIQVGAGIVADSVPEREYEETLNKARALFKAFEMARRDEIDDFSYR